MSKVRVAVVQFGTGNDVSKNLETCLRMIDRAAEDCQPDIIVLPEFCNHCAWYESVDHAYDVALDTDGDFLIAISQKAVEHKAYIKINVTLRRERPKASIANLLYSPDGKLVAQADKQVLMGNENNFLCRAETAGEIAETEFGKIGLFCCADGLLMETSRLLTVRGAQLILNSLNSFAEDEASLHIPVRAAENKVFQAAACKVDYLIPKEVIEPFAEKMKIDPEALKGAGESQIVAPDGRILAKAPKTGEAFVYADIDLHEAEDKRRADGTDILKSRRPLHYRQIAEKPSERIYFPGAPEVTAAVCQNVAAIAGTNADLIVLPEFSVDEGSFDRIQDLIGDSERYVVTSIQENDGHTGVLISKDGLIFEQKQLHPSKDSRSSSNRGDNLNTFDLPFGRLAIIVGEDSIYPESFRLAAFQNAEIVAVPFDVQERWETEFGLLERAVENRFSVVAATRPNETLGEFGSSLILTISEDFTLWTEWKSRPFDGKINYPIVHRAGLDEEILEATVFPSNSENRLVSQKTDVVDGRAWWLLGPLAEKSKVTNMEKN